MYHTLRSTKLISCIVIGRLRRFTCPPWFGAVSLLLCFCTHSFAQPNRIAQRIDSSQRFTIRGSLHPQAASQHDQGRADTSVQLDHLMLALKPSAAQAADLKRFLAEVHGDSGAAGCYYRDTGPVGATAALTLAADMPAAVPEITAIGGTTFDEGSGNYWNSTNESATKASAQSYIPETSWNDSMTNSPAASGGGVSQIFGKPLWQAGNGVPSDDARDVPDLAFPASAEHDGYMVYTTSGADTGWYIFGGTSAGAPAFSGMLALLNQYVVANGYQSNTGLGNINTRLYDLASSWSWAFHDTTSGDNRASAMICGGFLCSAPYKKSVGYVAGSGYDLVTGLGSLDAYSFFLAWKN